MILGSQMIGFFNHLAFMVNTLAIVARYFNRKDGANV